MTIRVAINGYGRIGRMTLRAFYEQNKPHDILIVAVNAPGQDEIARHLTQFDTVHGRFNASVSLTEDHQHLVVNGEDRKSTRLNSSHVARSYAVLCLKNKNMRITCGW